MNIKFLEFRRYNEKTDTYTWRIRRLYPEELNPLVQVRRAATIARKLSPKFFGKIRIANLDVMRSEYEPILAGSDQDAMWIHEVFLRRCIPNLTTDELASIFLHEAAHLMHRLYPEELKKIWSEDLAWQNTLARYPEITLNTSWFSEIMANTFAIKLSGMCALEAMDKVHKHSCDHVRMLYRIDLFGENEHNLSLKKTYDILQFYWRQREQLKKQSIMDPGIWTVNRAKIKSQRNHAETI